MADDTILEAVRAIRPYLPELLADAGSAAELDRALADLLAGWEANPRAEDDALERLSGPPEVAEWAAAFLEAGVPPDVRVFVEHGERYSGLPGHGEAPPVPTRYACPEGDYVRWRRGAELVPDCPTHGVPLEPSGREPGAD